MSHRHSNVTTSTHGFGYTICITQSQIHLFKPIQRTSKSAPKFLPESQDENVCQPLCIDPQGHGTHKLITKTYIKCLKWISHCHHRYPYARHTSSVLKSLKTQSDKKTSKGKLNSSQEDREEKTPYDSSISTKLAIHQDHVISRTWEREIKHIATGANPLPRGWTTPSSSWRPPGWWRWPPVMPSPLRQGAEKGL